MAGPVSQNLTYAISFTKSSTVFINALATLVAAIEHADPALLEDSIADAHARLQAALTGDPHAIRFEQADSRDEWD